MTNFHQRKLVSKLRCSDHALETEKGRHKPANVRKRKEERFCIYCDKNAVEDEKHFLYDCTLYDELRKQYHIWRDETYALFLKDNSSKTKDFIFKAFSLREENIPSALHSFFYKKLDYW